MAILTVNLTKNTTEPMYVQLYTYIKAEISAGRLAVGTKLPAKRKLAAHLAVSQSTIMAAYDQLTAEGYIYSRERSGTYVSQIEDLILLKQKREVEENISIENCGVLYDFSYYAVDRQNFPYASWRRLFRGAIDETDAGLLQAGQSRGSYALRTSICGYLHQARGVNCTPEQIVISTGTEQLLQIIALLLPPDTIYGLENPGYKKLNLLFASRNLSFKPIDVDEKGVEVAKFDLQGAGVIWLTPAHQFPTGLIMPISRKVQILNWANQQPQRYIVEDDYDSEFRYSGKPMPSLQGLDNNDKVIYLGSFSKALAPGLRVSYLVLPHSLKSIYAEKLSFLPCPVPAVIEKVLTAFIDKGLFERHLNRMRNIYKGKRELLVTLLGQMSDQIEIMGAEAGLHLLIKVDNRMTQAELVATALAEGVRVYGLKQYFLAAHPLKEQPIVLLGYAALTEPELVKAVSLLSRAWF